MRDLIRHAATLGASVHFAHIDDDPDLLGYYSPMFHRIVVRLGMTRAQRRWILAHEIGHAFYGHACHGSRTYDRAERQADKYAAELLIDPAEYARLEQLNADQHWLAEEFGVSVDCIFAYEFYCLTRLTNATYARARMGLGQWAHMARA